MSRLGINRHMLLCYYISLWSYAYISEERSTHTHRQRPGKITNKRAFPIHPFVHNMYVCVHGWVCAMRASPPNPIQACPHTHTWLCGPQERMRIRLSEMTLAVSSRVCVSRECVMNSTTRTWRSRTTRSVTNANIKYILQHYFVWKYIFKKIYVL